MNSVFVLIFSFVICFQALNSGQEKDNSGALSGEEMKRKVMESEKVRVISKAELLMKEKPVTITASSCKRSAGGRHDFFSEGPYWWPDPKNPDGPYIRKDGLRNPENFKDHDNALIRFSDIVATNTTAYLLTGEVKYVKAAMEHLNAWFVDTVTRMNPNMLYAQAITGICTGRGIGIIDANPLIDVARSVKMLERTPYADAQEIAVIKKWFRQFLNWLTTHPYGLDEIKAKNNHGTWCLAQVASYADLTGDQEMVQACRKRFMEIIIPEQMAADGSFPLELERTKPYSYSLFNLDALALSAWILSDKNIDLWKFKTGVGKGLNLGLEFMLPYIKDISTWPYQKDVSDWESQPGQRNFMIYAAIANNDERWFSLWESLGKKRSGNILSEERYHLLLWLEGEAVWFSKYMKVENSLLNPVPDEKGNIIPDFGKVGYNKGTSELPDVGVVTTLTAPVTGDAGEMIQAAIDALALKKADQNGFRGTILLKKGTYPISGSIRINQGGIVIRGEGNNGSGTVLVAAGKGKRNLVIISGKGSSREINGTRTRIIDSYVPVGSFSFPVEDISRFREGDLITLLRPGTENWIHDLKMDSIEERQGTKQWQAKEYDLRFEREIMKMDGNRIWIDQPVVMAMEDKYGGGTVFKSQNERISQAGIENILFRSDYTSETDEDHGWFAIEVQNCENGWVKNVTSQYFGNGCVTIGKGSKYITVTDSKCFDAKSQITGGRRYSFASDGQMCLVMNCETTEGRHDFVTGSRVCGPNVFYNCTARKTHADIGPHHRWSVGTLYDNITTDGDINIQDRGNWGSGHGWAGATQVLWNCTGEKVCVQSPWVSAENWCIGLKGNKYPGRLPGRPDGEWEGLNRDGLTPKSLYIEQKNQWKTRELPELVKGNLLFSDDFAAPEDYTPDFQPVSDGWKVRAWHADFKHIGEGIESIWQTGHNPVLAYQCSLQNVIIEVDFRFLGEQIPDSNGYCRVNLSNPDLYPRTYLASTWVNATAKNRTTGLVLENEVWPPGVKTTIDFKRAEFVPEKWYTITLEVYGDFARLSCNGHSVSGWHKQFEAEKSVLSIGVGKSRHQLRRLKVYEAIKR